MYTICTQCETAFRIEPEDLAMAAGEVRCGRCGSTFNALLNLSNEPPTIPDDGASDADTTLESRASSEEASEQEDADVEEQRLEASDESPEADTAADAEPHDDTDSDLETNKGPEHELAALEDKDTEDADEDTEDGDENIENEDEDAPEDADSEDEDPEDADSEDEDPEDEDSEDDDPIDEDSENDDSKDADSEDEDPEDEDSEDDDPIDEDSEDDDSKDADSGDGDPEDEDSEDDDSDDADSEDDDPEDEDCEDDDSEANDEAGDDDAEAAEDSEAVGEAEAEVADNDAVDQAVVVDSGNGRDEVLEVYSNDAFDEHDAKDLSAYLTPPRSKAKIAALALASVALAALLLAQLVHHFRADLATHPVFGRPVATLYDSLGIRLIPNWDVNSFGVEGTADIVQFSNLDANGEQVDGLRVSAIIVNNATGTRPAPVVKLLLQNRWGETVAARDFQPVDYVASDSASEITLSAGEKLRIELQLVDPGEEVVGFDIDLCLHAATGLLQCANGKTN